MSYNEISVIASFYGIVLLSVKLTLIDLTALRLQPRDFRYCKTSSWPQAWNSKI